MLRVGEISLNVAGFPLQLGVWHHDLIKRILVNFNMYWFWADTIEDWIIWNEEVLRRLIEMRHKEEWDRNLAWLGFIRSLLLNHARTYIIFTTNIHIPFNTTSSQWRGEWAFLMWRGGETSRTDIEHDYSNMTTDWRTDRTFYNLYYLTAVDMTLLM